MKLTSDLQADGHELRRARFEEGTVLPTNPFMGQLFHLKTAQLSKVFYFNGTQWICGVTSINGRQGDVTLTAVDVGLGNVTDTSDMDKPVSTAQAAAINAAVAEAQSRVSKRAFTLPALVKGANYTYTHNLHSTDIIVGFQDALTSQGVRLGYAAINADQVRIETDISIPANTVRCVVMA